jgi:hypothetical protein
MSDSTYSRISITLPRDLLVAADRRAAELERSRSWVLAEAVRSYLGEREAVGGRRVSEAAAPVYAAREVAEARRRHLVADLALPPAERLRRAEELVRLSRQVHGRRRRQQVIGFDSYEDFYEWKKAHRAGA